MSEEFNHDFIERKLRQFNDGVRWERFTVEPTKYKLRAVLNRLLECEISCMCGGEHFSDCPIIEAKEILKLW